MKEKKRTAVAAYLAVDRHLRDDLRSAKTLTQMAAELGTTKNTVRRWLRRDHWDLWMEYWASVEEIWEEAQRNRRLMSPNKCQAEKVAHRKQQRELMMALDSSLLEIVGGMGRAAW
jgi:uncharacterized protein YjcR